MHDYEREWMKEYIGPTSEASGNNNIHQMFHVNNQNNKELDEHFNLKEDEHLHQKCQLLMEKVRDFIVRKRSPKFELFDRATGAGEICVQQ